MKTITTKEDLLQWAKEVNFGVSLPRKCDLQDVYAHSKQSDIDRLLIECEADRKLIICSVYNCMAFGEVERLLNVLARHKCEKRMEIEYELLDNTGLQDVSLRTETPGNCCSSGMPKLHQYRSTGEVQSKQPGELVLL